MSIQKSLDKIESARYVVLGNVDSGKSSTIGVLEKNILDDGNGYARGLIAKFKHEQETGRTSSHTPHYLVNNGEITTLVDLCGHEKYLKTTMFGVMGLFADYGIMIVGSNMGITGMASEHFALLIANRIPFIVLFSKIDLCPSNIMHNVKKDFERIAKKNKKEVIYFEDDEKELNGSYLKEAHKSIIEAFQDKKTSIIPVIMTSNKTGHNINFVRELIISIRSKSYLQKKGLIQPIINQKHSEYPLIMYIDNTFSVTGIGIVLSGTVKYGELKLGQKVYLGPIDGSYITVIIKSMHNCISENVESIRENETGSIGIRLETKGAFTRESFSKGQIITTDVNFAMKYTCYSYNCDVAIFNHPTTIRNGYQTVLHCGTISQACKFKIKNNIILRTNSKENIDIKFMQRPEFILPGTLFMFRDGRTKGMGRVNSVIPYTEDTLDPIFRTRRQRLKKSERRKLQREKTKQDSKECSKEHSKKISKNKIIVNI